MEVRTGVEVDKKMLEEGGFDHVILAIGAKEPKLPIQGLEGNTVFVGDIYEKDAKVEGDTVIIGGGFSGVETAIYLARRGHKVTLLEREDELCGGLRFGTKHLEYYRVAVGTLREEKNITAITGARVTKVEKNKIYYKKGQEESCIDADTIVMAAGLAARTEEAMALCPEGVDVFLAGDCKKARDIEHATRTGFEAAVRIR